MFEEWRSVVGYPHYEVSNQGRVRRIPGKFRRKFHILKPYFSRCYLTAPMWVDGHRVAKRVHTLVLEAFIGPRPDGMECRHLDGDPQNNCVSNLCWGTPAENAADKHRHGTMCRGAQHGRSKLTDDDVQRIKEMSALGETQRAIAAVVGITQSQVSRILRGKAWY